MMPVMAETLTIRPAGAEDTAQIDALLARSYPRLLKADYLPSVLVLAVPILSRAQPALIRSGTYYVAETAEGAILGAGGWTARRRQRGVGDVRHVVTDDRHLRKGIGRALFERIFVEARRGGIKRLDCQATRTAVPFYRAMGFAVLGPVEATLGPGIVFPAIQMQRRL